MLLAFLDYFRAVLVDKASGLSDEQLHARLAPSSLTLGGLINHLAVVEDGWFTRTFAGQDMPEPWASAPWDDDEDWELTTAHEVPTPELFSRYEDAVARSRRVMDDVEDLDQPSQRSGRDGEPFSMRWILIHMIEETARHCGHADFLRESLDGATGDFRD
jgi:uncharacterized damage-inducible protein DinB